MKVALITGICGQDGSYLSELLLEKGYSVHGLMRRSSSFNTGRIAHLLPDQPGRFETHWGDVTDTSGLSTVIRKVHPDEIYHLAAQSHVEVSFHVPEYTGEVDALGTLRVLETVRSLGLKSKIYNASTSEIFGDSPPPQSEETPFRPRSPYGCAKLYGHWMTRNYREAYGMFCVNGILFNHESPRRAENFVSRKIVKNLVRIKKGKIKDFGLGNISAQRDWGHAKDYVRAMYLMLQQEKPQDFVISTGESARVIDFVNITALKLGMDLEWMGREAWWNNRRIIYSEKRQFRPLEVDRLRGDSSRARAVLGWKPEYNLDDLIEDMIEGEVNEDESAEPRWRGTFRNRNEEVREVHEAG